MLPHLHNAIRDLLHAQPDFPRDEVDVEFRPPTKAWVDELARPAICFRLVGLRENTALRQTNIETFRSGDAAIRRVPPRRFDLRYIVSAFAKGDFDREYALLWATLVTLLHYSPLPAELLPAPLRTLDIPVQTRIDADDGAHMPGVWDSLGATPRPALDYCITVPVDLALAETWSLVRQFTTRFHRNGPGDRPTIDDQRVRDAADIDGVVRDSTGLD